MNKKEVLSYYHDELENIKEAGLFKGEALIASKQGSHVILNDGSKLLNIDFAFTFTQNAKTTAWGNGVSLITPRDETSTEYSIWNSSQMVREDFITLKEPSQYLMII